MHIGLALAVPCSEAVLAFAACSEAVVDAGGAHWKAPPANDHPCCVVSLSLHGTATAHFGATGAVLTVDVWLLIDTFSL